MKKVKLLGIIIILITALTSCTKEETKNGAICNDGTSTSSVGSGTCSGHWWCKRMDIF